MNDAVFYSLDEKLCLIEHEAVALDRAREIFDQYYSRLKPHYDSGETALAETMFGFSRSEDEFLELCLHKYDSISCKICLPPPYARGFMRFFAGALNREETLSSRDAAMERLRQFFALSRDELREVLEAM